MKLSIQKNKDRVSKIWQKKLKKSNLKNLTIFNKYIGGMFNNPIPDVETSKVKYKAWTKE